MVTCDKHCCLSEAKTVQSCSETERLYMEKLRQGSMLASTGCYWRFWLCMEERREYKSKEICGSFSIT